MHDVCRNPEQMRDGVETSHAAFEPMDAGEAADDGVGRK
jgi:hypothetical protein